MKACFRFFLTGLNFEALKVKAVSPHFLLFTLSPFGFLVLLWKEGIGEEAETALS